MPRERYDFGESDKLSKSFLGCRVLQRSLDYLFNNKRNENEKYIMCMCSFETDRRWERERERETKEERAENWVASSFVRDIVSLTHGALVVYTFSIYPNLLPMIPALYGTVNVSRFVLYTHWCAEKKKCIMLSSYSSRVNLFALDTDLQHFCCG